MDGSVSSNGSVPKADARAHAGEGCQSSLGIAATLAAGIASNTVMTIAARFLFAVVVITLLGCGPGDGEVGEPGSEGLGVGATAGVGAVNPAAAPVVAIPTCEEFCGEDALAYGVLASDGESCVWFEGGDPTIAQNVVWPRGFAARFTAAGVELIDPDGEVLAREGDLLEMGGGNHDREEPSCAPGEGGGSVWLARTVQVVEGIPESIGDGEDNGGQPATVIANQPTLPTAEAYEHVGVATDPGELQRQWQRFGLADVPPVIDLDRRVLLFAGFGESGSCPYVFDGIAVEGQTVTFLDAQTQQECDADYNARTIVVSVAQGELPDGFLTLDLPADAGDVDVSVSGSAEPPPPTPNVVSAAITDVDLTVEPHELSAGEDAVVMIRNSTQADRVASGQVVTIDRWSGRHFEALGTLTAGEDVVEVGPGDTEALLSLSTRDPQFPTTESGWFRLTAALDVTTGSFGRLDARGHLHILANEAADRPGAHAITSGPPCGPNSSCASILLIDGVEFSPSCGLVDPAGVTEDVYATGEGHTVHVIDGVDPRVMVAWDNEHCGPPLDGRWRVMFAADQRGSTAENDAWCQASLNGPDPDEGFTC